MTQAATRPFCNLLAREAGLDPIGQAGAVDLFVTFELPLPWPYGLWQSPGLPAEIRRLIQLWYGDTDTPRPRLRPLAVAPEPEGSRAGYRRVMVHRRPEGAFADYAKREWHLPEAELGPLVWALLMEPDTLPRYDRFEERQRPTRDYLICTHGSVDAACAKYGYPLYRALHRRAGADVRVWRVSHFGGHVFAPTLLELPAGRFWAYMEGEAPRQLLARRGDTHRLHGHYRGWSGCETGFLQAAEREALVREGWAWLDYLKRGLTLAQDEAPEPAWAEVQLDFAAPDGVVAGAYRARVERGRPIETPYSTASELTLSYPQYRVVALEKVAG